MEIIAGTDADAACAGNNVIRTTTGINALVRSAAKRVMNIKSTAVSISEAKAVSGLRKTPVPGPIAVHGVTPTIRGVKGNVS